MFTTILSIVGSISSSIGLIIQIWMWIDYQRSKTKPENK